MMTYLRPESQKYVYIAYFVPIQYLYHILQPSLYDEEPCMEHLALSWRVPAR